MAAVGAESVAALSESYTAAAVGDRIALRAQQLTSEETEGVDRHALGRPPAQLERLTKKAAAARFDEGVAFTEQENWPEALKAFRAAAEMDPELSNAWFNIGCAECMMNGGEHCEAEYAPLTR